MLRMTVRQRYLDYNVFLFRTFAIRRLLGLISNEASYSWRLMQASEVPARGRLESVQRWLREREMQLIAQEAIVDEMEAARIQAETRLRGVELEQAAQAPVYEQIAATRVEDRHQTLAQAHAVTRKYAIQAIAIHILTVLSSHHLGSCQEIILAVKMDVKQSIQVVMN